ncbi:MAG: AAA family ATPase [Syntrophales bacterium]|jgi:DNA sulfur modification protein DndD|nr:AAA family ATPase [Syntrophales bacterium]
MILHKLIVENFRQFRGRQEIEFWFPSLPHHNVTVVFGENGRGKTGLFRAIMFCLFGERRLSQDGDVPREELQLVNVSALEADTGVPVRTSVELEFAHLGQSYRLRRAILGMQDGNRIIEEEDEKRLFVITSDGNTQTVPTTEIDAVIDSILDRRVKDYFLFDGEKIERLTRASIEQRREISAGIRNLLNVDALETAIRAVGRVSKALERELSNSSHEELSRLLKRLSDNEDEQTQLRGRLDSLADEMRLARQEIDKTDNELKKFNEIRHLLDRRKILEQELKEQEQLVDNTLKEMHSLVCKASSLILAPTVITVFEHIERQKQKGEIPSEIRRDLIERILTDDECICGRDILKDPAAHSHILDWQKRTSDVTTQDAALNLWRYLSEVRNHFSDDADLVEKRLQQYGNIRSTIANINRSLENVSNQIGTSERQDATKLDEHRKKLQDGIITLEANARNAQTQLEQLKQEEERLRALLKEERLKVGRNDELSRRSMLARDTQDALKDVYDQFTREIKQLIGQSATELFAKLLDKEGRENLRTIVVNNDYSLQVLDRYKKPFLANISAGQRQIMSIAFIAALARAASRGGQIEIPLFMDTPFGRLSFEHRQNLINYVPTFASQWILLATDTEFRRQEAQLLKTSGKWGKFYILRPTLDGNTAIVEQDINSALAILRDEEEY